MAKISEAEIRYLLSDKRDKRLRWLLGCALSAIALLAIVAF